jgi:anti-sigma regulatory factor (Ser/Thr protein kinase)
VSFYDHGRELTETLARFVGEGLAEGERVVVVATGPHRAALDAALRDHGVNVARERLSGRFVEQDAAELLGTFLRDGTPQPDLFHETVGRLVTEAGSHGDPVRVFGEMVSLLWDQGRIGAAIDLETLWNALSGQTDFSLLCAYPTAGLDGARLGDVRDVCAVHSDLLPPASYADGDPTGSDSGGHFSQVFLPVHEAVVAVRRFVTAALRLWGDDDLVEDAVLVASELATNAVMHASSPFRLSVDRSIGVICLAIQDAASGQAREQSATDDGLSGRGMAIVNALSRRWGCDSLPAGKVVWAELVVGPGRHSSASRA